MDNQYLPKVLFVDDEKNILRSIKRSFIKKPFEIFTANSAKEGLTVLETQNIDIVVSDVKMPEIDGITFLTDVKKLYPNINRIILSGYVEKEAVINTILTGVASTYLTKPWINEELSQKLEYIWNIENIISNKTVLKKINKIEKLPDSPKLYQEFIDAATMNLSMNHISDIISKDISITTKIIQVVNSAFHSVNKVSSLETSVTLLGLNHLKSIIYTTILMKEKKLSRREEMELLKVNEQSYRVNKILPKLYKLRFGKYLDNEYKSLGLIYEVGKLILIRDFSDYYIELMDELNEKNSIDFYAKELEKGNEGGTYKEIGAYFLYLWNFSNTNISAALFDLNMENLNNEEREVIDTLQLADKLVKYEARDDLDSFYNSNDFKKSNLSEKSISKILNLSD